MVFDVETGPRGEVISNPEQWYKADARLKDPAKVFADLAEKAKDTSALSPITGQVLAIGTRRNDGTDAALRYVSIKTSEKELLGGFLGEAAEMIRTGGLVVGFNSHDFDWPFVLFRAKALGVEVPACIGTRYRAMWSMAENCVDLMNLVRYGRYDRTGYSLNKVCRAMGLGGKTGNGAMFADLMATDLDAALDYLHNDIDLTYKLAERIL